MKFFRVYQHKKKGFYAAPVGFNMQAAILNFLWAAANNLWGKALLLFVYVAGMLAVIIYGNATHMQMLIYVGIAGLSLAPIWSGVSGNEWIFSHLESQGYSLIKKVRAKDAREAISKARSKGGSSAGTKRRSAQSKAKAEEDLPINAEPEWRKRKNNRMIK